MKAYKECDEKKSNVLKWFRGEYRTKSEARKELDINVIITDSDWYEYCKIFNSLLIKTGYKGMLLLFDELVNIYKIPNSVTRQYNYEKILTMYNDTLQGKVSNMGIIMCSTQQCLEDTRKGIFSYEALKSRLESGWIRESKNSEMFTSVIKLCFMSHEEAFVLLEKLSKLHSELYEYRMSIKENEILEFLKAEYRRVGTDIHVTPRKVIRNYIELLNALYQNTN